MEIQEDSKIVNSYLNKLRNDVKYYKVLNKEMNHHGFQYQLGLNVDTHPLNKEKWCARGGIHITTLDNIHRYLGYGVYIAEIEIPADAVVLKDDGDIKADKIIIKNIKKLKDFDELWGNEKLCIRALKTRRSLFLDDNLYYGRSRTIQYVKNQTHEICMTALMKDGLLLKYVKEQTPDLCLAAVTQNGNAIKYVKEQTRELCKIAVNTNGCCIDWVDAKTQELCLDAINQNVLAIHRIRLPDHNMIALAISKSPEIIVYFVNCEPVFDLLAVIIKPTNIRCVKNQTKELLDISNADRATRVCALIKCKEELSAIGVRNDIICSLYVE
jgi:hypothetical protein